MRVVVFGNSGSGKSHYARGLARTHGLAHLDLDTLVWQPGQIAVRRPANEVERALRDFMRTTSAWVIEGCYGELVKLAATACTELVFLNPGLDTCLANNRRRPWEPHKYATPAQQDAMLDALQAWVAGYYTRSDDWSYAAHRRLYDAHDGPKRERLTPPAD